MPEFLPGYEDRFFDIIEDSEAADPRSLQREIGPSGLGNDCMHCLACDIFQIPRAENRREIWNQAVGRACHEAMQTRLLKVNEAQGRVVYLPERKVWVGDLAGKRIGGTADCYDVDEGIVVDWKFPGDKSMDWVRQHGPSESYRRQPHLYGLGYENEGFEVRAVMILFIPRNDRTVRNSFAYKVPYDRELALATMDRAQRLHDTVMSGGGPATVIPRLKRKKYCISCPEYPL